MEQVEKENGQTERELDGQTTIDNLIYIFIIRLPLKLIYLSKGFNKFYNKLVNKIFLNTSI